MGNGHGAGTTARKAKSAPHSQHRVRARSSADNGSRGVGFVVATEQDGGIGAEGVGACCPEREGALSGEESGLRDRCDGGDRSAGIRICDRVKNSSVWCTITGQTILPSRNILSFSPAPKILAGGLERISGCTKLARRC